MRKRVSCMSQMLKSLWQMLKASLLDSLSIPEEEVLETRIFSERGDENKARAMKTVLETTTEMLESVSLRQMYGYIRNERAWDAQCCRWLRQISSSLNPKEKKNVSEVSTTGDSTNIGVAKTTDYGRKVSPTTQKDDSKRLDLATKTSNSNSKQRRPTPRITISSDDEQTESSSEDVDDREDDEGTALILDKQSCKNSGEQKGEEKATSAIASDEPDSKKISDFDVRRELQVPENEVED